MRGRRERGRRAPVRRACLETSSSSLLQHPCTVASVFQPCSHGHHVPWAGKPGLPAALLTATRGQKDSCSPPQPGPPLPEPCLLSSSWTHLFEEAKRFFFFFFSFFLPILLVTTCSSGIVTVLSSFLTHPYMVVVSCVSSNKASNIILVSTLREQILAFCRRGVRGEKPG